MVFLDFQYVVDRHFFSNHRFGQALGLVDIFLRDGGLNSLSAEFWINHIFTRKTMRKNSSIRVGC